MSKKSNSYDGKIAGLYDLEETLGRGHFAVVKLARHVFTGEKVAVKVIDKSKLDDVSRAHLFQEVRCMKLVQHPNVVRLYEVIDTHTKLYLVLELGDGGDLYDYIMRHEGGLTEEVARTYFRQIVKAISYCHRLHVVHRDLKPENVVFFEKSGTVKLTDFGFSNRFCPGQKLETSCGSLAYSAPEILLGDRYDAPAVDIWSLGVILYMLVCGRAPFQEANDSETLTMIMDCKYSVPKHISDECKNLIAKMLIREPEKRATLDDIANDKWFTTDVNQDSTEIIPLVSREQVSEDHHNLIITKMVNGNIATKEEILEALDRNEYNHVTATYFLLAERKLRADRQESLFNKEVKYSIETSSDPHMINQHMDQSFLKVPCFPNNMSQNTRSRKCSIVQEEEDEDVSSGKDDANNSSILNKFNRRGSRSEGKLSQIYQERLVHIPEKSLGLKTVRNAREDLTFECKNLSSYEQLKKISDSDHAIPTNLLTKYNSVLKTSTFESEPYEKPQAKIHNIKSKSCSSSDASDDDSKNRKKRLSKLSNSTKALPKRRNNHDDSSDSQDPGGGSTSYGGARNIEQSNSTLSSNCNDGYKQSDTKTYSTTNTGKQHQSCEKTNTMYRKKFQFRIRGKEDSSRCCAFSNISDQWFRSIIAKDEEKLRNIILRNMKDVHINFKSNTPLDCILMIFIYY